MRSQPLPGEASRRRAEEQFKTTKKVNSETRRPTIPHGKPRPRKRRAYARFGWPRKQPTRILQIAALRQRRPGDLSHAGAFEDLRPQPRQNPSKAQRDFCPPSRQVCASSAKHRELLRDETNRFVQVSTFNMRAPDRSPAEICSTQVRSTQIGVVEFRSLEVDFTQAGTGEVRLPQRSAAEISPRQGGTAHQGVVEIAPPQVCATEVRSA